VRETASFSLRGSKCRSRLSIADDLWPAMLDVGQIGQVLNNFLVNAVQAMPEGGWVDMSAENLRLEGGEGLPLEPGRYLKITVEDEGVGIPADDLPKVFDPFFTTKREGTGLGLATSYSIVRRHSGHMNVTSREGIGTSFHVYLPASSNAPPLSEAAAPKRLPVQARILIMDDEALVRLMLSRMLESLGHRVTVTSDGAEAIEAYLQARSKGAPFDTVIVDLTVPAGVGGRSVLETLLCVDSKVKVIVSSGYSADATMANTKDHGFAGVIPKPFSLKQLQSVLEEVLGGNS
jgi:CheY-like chemotaxis protein